MDTDVGSGQSPVSSLGYPLTSVDDPTMQPFPLDCSLVMAPTLQQHFQDLNLMWLCLIGAAGLVTFLSCILFTVQSYAIFHYVNTYYRATKMTSLIAIFPIVSVCSLITLCIPRAIPVADMLLFLWNLRRVELALAQNAFVRPTLHLVNACVWINELGNFSFTKFNPSPFISALNVTSTMTAMWSIMVMVKAYAPHMSHYRLNVQLRVVQLLLVLLNMQGSVIDLLSTILPVIKCTQTLPASVIGHMMHHTLLIGQVFFIQLLVTVLLRPAACGLFDLHPNNQTNKPGLGHTKSVLGDSNHNRHRIRPMTSPPAVPFANDVHDKSPVKSDTNTHGDSGLSLDSDYNSIQPNNRLSFASAQLSVHALSTERSTIDRGRALMPTSSISVSSGVYSTSATHSVAPLISRSISGHLMAPYSSRSDTSSDNFSSNERQDNQSNITENV